MKLLKNSVIYSVSTFVQKGLMFLLLPIYTRYISVEEYGIATVVLAISFICSIFFTLGLDSAIVRFYFDLKDSIEDFSKFFGTLLISLVTISIVNFALLATVLSPVIQYFMEDIPFNPYGYVGFAILIFQPLYNLCLSFLQATNQAARYSYLSFLYFFLNVGLTLVFLVHFEMEAKGYLMAILIAQAISSVTGLILIRKNFVLVFNYVDLKKAFRYSFPLVPHSLASQTTSYADRIILNKLTDSTKAGIYHLGYVLSIPVEVLTYSINRAYTPLFFERIKGSEEEKASIIEAGLVTTVVYFLSAAGLSLFAFEIIFTFFKPEFIMAHKVVPFVAFAFVNVGLYYLFSTILFYDKRLTRYIPVCTVLSGFTTVALNLLLIPRYGLLGSGAALFCGQLLLAVMTYLFSRKSDLIQWPIIKIILSYVVTATVVLIILSTNAQDQIGVYTILIKLLALTGIYIFCSLTYWRSPLQILKLLRSAINEKNR